MNKLILAADLDSMDDVDPTLFDEEDYDGEDDLFIIELEDDVGEECVGEEFLTKM